MQLENKIYIGTSGWHYKYWMGTFYPPEVKPKDFTSYYLKFFRTVEINNSFYKLPTHETFASWYASVPDDFVFAVKASRYITHMKKLKDPQTSIMKFIENVAGLKEKLGPILFQLPPAWKFSAERFRGGCRRCLPITAIPSNSGTRPGTTKPLTSCSGSIMLPSVFMNWQNTCRLN